VYLVLFAVTYYFTARFGLRFRFQYFLVGIIWPANAVLLAALALTPRRRWWLVLTATALAHTAALGPVVPVWRLLWQIAGNTVFTAVTAESLRRIVGPRLHLGNRHQVVAYVVISLVSPLLFTFTAPAFVLSLFHLEPNFNPATALLKLTLSNATAFLLVAPVILLWANYDIRRVAELPAYRVCEAATLTISLLAVGFFVFSKEPEVVLSPTLLLWFFPPLLWAAIRFGPIGASTSLFGIGAMSIWGTARHLGPFVLAVQGDMVLSLQLFWIVICIPTMLLAGVIREREEVEQRLRESQEELNRDYERVSKLARRFIGAQDDERTRIERELHDDVSQLLGAQIAALQLEREKQTAHLQEVEKIATAGKLAASLAHEINNPLSAVINVLYLLAGRSDLDPASTGLISIANNEIARVSRIVRQSLSYYRVGMVAKEVDLSALLEESLQVFSDKFQRGGIAIGKKIAPGTTVVGFADEIRQVVDNLLVNAVEATPPGGRLALCLRQSRSWKNRSELGARLTIADNGCGIPKAYLARVFEPFFTTKAEKGNGLGLWVVRGIVEKHGGSIKIRSTDAAARSGTVISTFWPWAVEGAPAGKLARSIHAA
jgi:signal transduction histidine kinase